MKQKDTVDPRIVEQLNVLSQKFDEAFNNNDAAALAACFTKDAVLVTDTGQIYGREAIERYQADAFQEARHSNHIGKRDQYSPHIIGTAGNEEWETGEWSCTLKGETSDAIRSQGLLVIDLCSRGRRLEMPHADLERNPAAGAC